MSKTLTLDSRSLFSAASGRPPPPTAASDFPTPNLIPNSRFIVDNFRHPNNFTVSYFLSHFHADHYAGLTNSWSSGIIFCSPITSKLLVNSLGVSPNFVIPLDVETRFVIDGWEVFLVDANHCPGAVQFLFRRGKEKYIHTGDFRFSEKMSENVILQEFVGADALFLDTTYCNRKFMFPSQEESICYIVNTINRIGGKGECDKMKSDGSVNTVNRIKGEGECDKMECDDVFMDTSCNQKSPFLSQESSVDYSVNAIDRIGGEGECDKMNRDNALFLDTANCSRRNDFPSQEESVDCIANAIYRGKKSGERVLFIVATYVIGKERILFEIARRCGCLVCVDGRKMGILRILGYDDSEVFTEDESKSNVHVVGWNLLGETWPYFRPNFVKMKEIMVERGYDKAVGFVATGWMYETKKDGFAVRKKEPLEIHLVPYSEHSSYDELREYVKFLRPKRVVPTVGVEVDKLDSKGSLALQKHFAGLLDEKANKHEFLSAFHQKLSDVTIENNVAVENDVSTSCEEMVDQEDLAEQNASFNSEAKLDFENIDELVKELQDCLPHWVTHDLGLDLLKRSDKDIVKAVSDFFEHETEFYKQAKVHICSDPLSTSSREIRLDNLLNQIPEASHNLDLMPKSSQKAFEAGLKNSVFQVVSSTNQSSRSPSQSKKRSASSSASSSNKSKKKGKSIPNSQATGSKQSTITRFFGKAAPTNSPQDTSLIDRHNPEMEEPVESNKCEAYKLELDQFLQIINNGIPRHSAAALLEKTKGDLDLAVDTYYNGVDDVNSKDKSLLLQADVPIGRVNSSINKLSSPIGKANVSTLYLQGSLRNDSTTSNVSLPIENYLPVEHACWKPGQPAPYLHIARTFDLVEQEKGKIKTTTMLCNMFRSLLALSPDDVLSAVYLCTNKIAADHENMELNIGGGLVTNALEEACGTSRSRIKEMFNVSGDLGDVAQEIRQTQSLLAPPPPLSVGHLFDTLRKISMISGFGSSQRRKKLIVNIMRSCREMEMKFLVRTLVRNLRIGAMMKTILPALAQAVVLNCYAMQHMEAPADIKVQLQGISTEVAEAYNILPNLDMLIPSLMKQGVNFSASSLEMVPGTPIPPMLARITNGVTQVLKLFQGKAFTCEYKYDGQRAQIHRLADGSIRIFSRQMKESTLRFPDLTQIIKELSDGGPSSFILDAEVVAVDRKNGCKLMAFQELSSRERGGKDFSIQLENIKVDICVFIFDVVLLNGERLLDTPLRQRREYMKSLFKEEKVGYLEFAKEITVESDEACPTNQSTLSKVNSFFEDAFRTSCEGIMVKTLDVNAGYFASKRSDAWLKVKRDYVEGLGDSLDLVPIGAWHGNGRKAGWYSPFLMACYNPDTEEFQSVCRVMSGFTDDFYTQMKAFFSGDKLLPKKPAYYRTDEFPDFWFSAELVWEIRGADLTLSPVHHAAHGMIHPSRGISVRLPRYVCSRPDRKPEDCSAAADIAEMYTLQTRKIDVNEGD